MELQEGRLKSQSDCFRFPRFPPDLRFDTPTPSPTLTAAKAGGGVLIHLRGGSRLVTWRPAFCDRF
jgi:hypothetical protein